MADCSTCGAKQQYFVWCEFCNKTLCELCTKSSDFGHVCDECLEKINDGRINEHGYEPSPKENAMNDDKPCYEKES